MGREHYNKTLKAIKVGRIIWREELIQRQIRDVFEIGIHEGIVLHYVAKLLDLLVSLHRQRLLDLLFEAVGAIILLLLLLLFLHFLQIVPLFLFYHFSELLIGNLLPSFFLFDGIVVLL